MEKGSLGNHKKQRLSIGIFKEDSVGKFIISPLRQLPFNTPFRLVAAANIIRYWPLIGILMNGRWVQAFSAETLNAVHIQRNDSGEAVFSQSYSVFRRGWLTALLSCRPRRNDLPNG